MYVSAKETAPTNPSRFLINQQSLIVIVLMSVLEIELKYPKKIAAPPNLAVFDKKMLLVMSKDWFALIPSMRIKIPPPNPFAKFSSNVVCSIVTVTLLVALKTKATPPPLPVNVRASRASVLGLKSLTRPLAEFL